jgi:hypothetical protein
MATSHTMRLLFIFLVLSTISCLGLAPIYVEHPDSKLLPRLGFSVSIERASGEDSGLWMAEVFFKKSSKLLPDDYVSVIFLDEAGNTICQNDHSLSDIVTFTSPNFDKGKMEKRFGFRFYATEKHLKAARLKFWLITDKKKIEQEGVDGIHIIYLKEYFTNGQL